MTDPHPVASAATAGRPSGAEGRVELARLVVDRDGSPAAGTRMAVVDVARRQLVWHSTRADLALTMWVDEWSRNAISVDGQVLPHAAPEARSTPDAPYTVVLKIEGVPVARVPVDTDGCFSFEGLDRGAYEFELLATDHQIVAGPIDVVDTPGVALC